MEETLVSMVEAGAQASTPVSTWVMTLASADVDEVTASRGEGAMVQTAALPRIGAETGSGATTTWVEEIAVLTTMEGEETSVESVAKGVAGVEVVAITPTILILGILCHHTSMGHPGLWVPTLTHHLMGCTRP